MQESINILSSLCCPLVNVIDCTTSCQKAHMAGHYLHWRRSSSDAYGQDTIFLHCGWKTHHTSRLLYVILLLFYNIPFIGDNELGTAS